MNSSYPFSLDIPQSNAIAGSYAYDLSMFKFYLVDILCIFVTMMTLIDDKDTVNEYDTIG